jgi:quinohemoprotein ethanol dehydrogenase
MGEMAKSRIVIVASLMVSVATLSACNTVGASGKGAAVDDKRLLAANADADNWLSYGRTYDEQRFSPLTDVSDKNVSTLGLEWSSDLDTSRGQEATPIVVDGVMYISTAWSMVKAYDASTGKKLWEFDPKVPREKLVDVCCDAVNRGVAVYQGKIYVATIAGELVALNADTGAVVWKIQSTDKASHMTITGAPRIVKGKVLIGSAGSEYITRGHITAYDAENGKEVWRFYTVPGDPSKPFEGKHLESAAKTWSGDYWKNGGGGTVWDSISYDPQTDLVYFGTANAEPWNPAARGNGKGDSLYTASIVAVNPDTGAYAWHYQETPEDRWDFDSNQQIIVTNLNIGGTDRRVLMHAPKNGFFYVLDAKTGKFISGKPFAKVTWASGLDPVTGRPNVNPEARYEQTGKPFISLPGALGAHSWTPMSYSPKTGLVYIPANEAMQPYNAAAKGWKPSEVGFQLGLEGSVVSMPAIPAVRAGAAAATTGSLVAWDPVAQKARWTVAYPGPSNGGTLATAGNLVFQGTAGGEFRAYSADTGKQLWSFPTQTGVLAAPMTYRVKGQQYVAILVGWGGVLDVAPPGFISRKSGSVRNISRLLVFKIGGKGSLPAPAPQALAVLDPPPFVGKPEQVADGAVHYANSCSVCHGDSGIAGGNNPDVRHSAALNNPKLWQQIVHDGILKENGMVAWSKNFSPVQIENIRQYVIKRANEDKALEGSAAKKVASR